MPPGTTVRRRFRSLVGANERQLDDGMRGAALTLPYAKLMSNRGRYGMMDANHTCSPGLRNGFAKATKRGPKPRRRP
jgi:hypothetical protein